MRDASCTLFGLEFFLVYLNILHRTFTIARSVVFIVWVGVFLSRFKYIAHDLYQCMKRRVHCFGWSFFFSIFKYIAQDLYHCMKRRVYCLGWRFSLYI